MNELNATLLKGRFPNYTSYTIAVFALWFRYISRYSDTILHLDNVSRLVNKQTEYMEDIFSQIDIIRCMFFNDYSHINVPEKSLNLSNLITYKSKLGAGSYGIVYKGKLNSNNVAVKKFIDINKNRVHEQYEEWCIFMKEYCLISKLQDTGVVGKLYGVRWCDNYWSMVIQQHYIKSIDWNKHELNTRERTIRIIQDAFNAIQTIHMVTGYVHGDIKPDNILIDIVDGEPKVQIIDFGLSEPVGELQSGHEYIQTIFWRAPELLEAIPCDLVLTDIWAITIAAFDIMAGGCVMFELGAKHDINNVDMLKLLMSRCMNRNTIPEEWAMVINDDLIDFANELYAKYIVDASARLGFS